jgi:hypothetical protein
MRKVVAILVVLMVGSCSDEEHWTDLDLIEKFPREYMREESLCLNGDWEVLTDDGKLRVS